MFIFLKQITILKNIVNSFYKAHYFVYSTVTMITLQAEIRTNEKTKALRAADKIPAVYYSAGKESVKISVSLRDFVKVFKEAGETTAVTLTVDGKKVPTLIHDVQHNPVNGTFEHVDFLVIDMKKEIEVPVPIEFEGLAPAEKNGLGTVVKSLHEVEVRALPDAMPHAIIVSLDSLATLEDQIRVSDLVLPAGVTVITDGEEIVASVAAFVEETEEAAPIDLSAIEVAKKGKKESEEDAE